MGDDGCPLLETGVAIGGDTIAAPTDPLKVEEPWGVKNNSLIARGTDGGTNGTMVVGKMEAKGTGFCTFSSLVLRCPALEDLEDMASLSMKHLNFSWSTECTSSSLSQRSIKPHYYFVNQIFLKLFNLDINVLSPIS